EPGTDGAQRRSGVPKRRISVDERGVGNFAGGAAIAQRRTHYGQQPASGEPGAAAQYQHGSQEHLGQLTDRGLSEILCSEPVHQRLTSNRSPNTTANWALAAA